MLGLFGAHLIWNSCPAACGAAKKFSVKKSVFSYVVAPMVETIVVLHVSAR